MPKVTSTSRSRALGRDKENEAPTMSHYSRKQKGEKDEDDEEAMRNLPLKSLKHSGSSSSRVHHSSSGLHAKERNGSSSSNSRDTEMQKTSKDSRYHNGGEGSKGKRSYDQAEERKEHHDVPEDNGDLQAQLDQLRSLRITEPERLLGEWRKMADQKSKKSEEYIAVLKKHVEALSSSQGKSVPTIPSANQREDENVTTLQKEMEEMRKREKALKEENARQARQLESLRMQTGTSTSSTAYRLGTGSSQLGMGDERAVRRLYEDLTGLMINKVEQVEGQEEFRRFHAIFACAGYHDLEIKLEESTSDLPSIVPGTTSGPREDLIYTPTLDQDRDAELLQSGRLPEFLKDSIRFERATSVKFMTTLHKRLDRHSKR
ncbi:uncharacterized protein FA14DRAFT_13183 [Meira miltonrushii]|uniref:Monopolin complex subunit Csm1/Pcs1 C-terminal domain-containing protein n=1 Tax=Meira miltonrushii TaxID=1280837 RepID=A0A316VIK6_9BASI|nr:uncharacterized protein FA14DRAFT_13183 [Meira miltonrushii]PWN37340.1 hypothetical protein FA14DRAFT_13183 [Meira miltonrushii]